MKENTTKNQYEKMTRQMLASLYEENNLIFSPLSYYLLLALAYNATAAESQKEIAEVLGNDDINEYAKLLSVDSKELQIASGLCLDKTIAEAINKDYLRLGKRIFDLEIFSSDNALKAINDWVRKKTDGMIPMLLDSLPENFRLCLLNAICFKGKWDKRYRNADIYDESFAGFDKNETVTYLSSEENEYLEDDYYTGFLKDYRGKRYAFMGLLPKNKGKEGYKEAIKHLDIMKLYQKREWMEVKAIMPEFEADNSLDLVALSKELGINEIFSDCANFSVLTNDAIKISSIIQKAYIKVDRSGTKAAAASAMIAVAMALPIMDRKKTVALDRPFVYCLFDREKEMPVFVGCHLCNH